MNILISTIRAIINRLQSSKDDTESAWKRTCVYIVLMRRVWVAKDSPRTTAGELQKIVESRGQKTLKRNCRTTPTSPHVVWEGFKKNSPRSSKNKPQHIQLSDTTGTSNGTGFYGQMKPNTQDGFVNTGIKSTHVYNEIFCCMFCFMLWAYISTGGPGYLV